jgi:putative transposase
MYKPEMSSSRKIRITEFIVDETIIKGSSEYIWLWMAIENDNREILQISISKERNMFVAERFIKSCKKIWGTSCFHRWWYMISTGLQILETKPPHPFFI